MSWTFDSVAIVGAGAIGLYYGGRLAAAGKNVRFLLRSDFDEVKRDGIRCESVHGDFHVPKVQGYRRAEEIGPVDLVIVSWKTTANSQLESVLRPLLHADTQVLTLQNGLGNCEAIAALTGPERVLGGLCFVCLNRLAPGFVSHTAGGRLSIGEFRPDDRGRGVEIVRRFKEAGISAEPGEPLAAAQWRKLVWNIPFNGLAITGGGVTTDVLLDSPEIESRIRSLMAETIAAAKAQGLDLDEDLIEFNIARTRPMGPYRPSSMIDFAEGREVEVEAIWAEPLRRARAVGVQARQLARLLEEIGECIANRTGR